MPGDRLPLPVLMLVTDRTVAGGEDALVEKVGQAIEGGVNVVQLREKDLGRDELVSLARRVREVVSGRALLVVNGTPQLALDARADGVHLPEGADLPREWPRSLLMGRSVHSEETARRAEIDGADYLVFGSVYETESHVSASPAGSGALREVAAAVSIPVIAIGGVTINTARDVIAAGAAGIAVIRAIMRSQDPQTSAAELLEAMSAKGAPA